MDSSDKKNQLIWGTRGGIITETMMGGLFSSAVQVFKDELRLKIIKWETIKKNDIVFIEKRGYLPISPCFTYKILIRHKGVRREHTTYFMTPKRNELFDILKELGYATRE